MTRHRLCWRHYLSLYSLAFGSLLDLSGRMWTRGLVRLTESAYECSTCEGKNTKVPVDQSAAQSQPAKERTLR